LRTRDAASRAGKGEDGLAQGLADAFVGIDAQHPVIGRLRNGELLLRPEAAPFALDHARAMFRR
jgi:hypothetical protein